MNNREKTSRAVCGTQDILLECGLGRIEKNVKQYEAFLVCRLADKGDHQAVSWLKQNYDVHEIAKMIQRSRSVSVKPEFFGATMPDVFEQVVRQNDLKILDSIPESARVSSHFASFRILS